MQQVPQIGPYQIVAELGRGGMGVVYEVSDPSLPGRRLALKQILKTICGPEALRRFAREAEMLAKVQHPNVVRVYACTLDPLAYLVTELVEGQDLKALCVREQLDPRRCAEITAQLGDAVGALHSAGIIHRDLKPENAILRPDGRPVLLDFGLARELDGEGLTRTGEVLGTPAYMSPEQADASKDIDERTDVYGLGAILFQLLAGRAPFQAASMVKLLYKVLQEEPDWSALRDREVPAPLIAITQRALEKERDERYPSAQALAADLRRFLQGEAVLAQPRRSRKGPLLIAGALALALAGGAGALALAKGSSAASPTPSASQAPSRGASQTPGAPDPLQGIRTPRQFREGLSTLQQLELIEPFLASLGERRGVAVERLRVEPLWELRVQPAIKRSVKENLERGALFLPDGSYLTWHGRSRKLQRVTAEGALSWELPLPHIANACAQAPDGSIWVFEATRAGSRVVASGGDWSKPPRVESIELAGDPEQNRIVKVVAFSPSKTLVALGLGGRGEGRKGAFVLDLSQAVLTPRYLPPPPEGNPMTEAFLWSADSSRLYTGGEGGGPKRTSTFGYALDGPEPRLVFKGPDGIGTTITTYALARVGDDLLQAQRDGYVRRVPAFGASPADRSMSVVDSGDEEAKGKTHSAEVVALLATRAGDWIYSVAGPFASGTAHKDHTRNQIRVWSCDPTTSALSLHATINYPSAARRAYLSPDGKRLIMICVDGQLRLYDAWLLRQ